MSTTGRTAEPAPAASDVAGTLREAGFVRLVARADGDALAASGLLARALADAGVPFEASVVRTTGAASRRLDGTEGQPLAVGLDVAGATLPRTTGPASVTAYETATELGADPDPGLALAGAFAAGLAPGEGATAPLLDAASVERGPGLVAPTDDPVDGLAHSTFVHADFSGRPDDAEDVVVDVRTGADDPPATDPPVDDPLDAESGRRRLASLVAVDVAGDDRATDRAAAAIERAVQPHRTPDGPFATLGGHTDVLGALAREQPGTGVALALGSDRRDAALAAWRDHARRAHEGLQEATTGRYDGLFVARVEDAPVETTARLLADFRSPEPLAMVVADGEAAVAGLPGESLPADHLRAAADALDGDASVGPRTGYATFDGESRDFVAAFRETR